MRFDGGRWSILGDAGEVRKSDERRKIVSALKEAGDEETPAAIAKLAGMKAESIENPIRPALFQGSRKTTAHASGYFRASRCAWHQ
jgi:hypothetical protein